MGGHAASDFERLPNECISARGHKSGHRATLIEWREDADLCSDQVLARQLNDIFGGLGSWLIRCMAQWV